MSYNLKMIINNLNFKSKMHTLSNSCSTNVVFMNPNISKLQKMLFEILLN